MWLSVLPVLAWCLIWMGTARAERVVVSFYADAAVFRDSNGPYVEILLAVDASNLAYREVAPNRWKARTHVNLRCEPRSGKGQPYVEQFTLNSPELPDTNRSSRRFYLIQGFRFAAQPDSMRLTVEVKDAQADSASTTKIIRDFDVPSPNRLPFSDIVWLEALEPAVANDPFTKHGLRFKPYIADDVFLDADSLRFYVEYYDTDQLFGKAKHALRLYLTEAQRTEPIAGTERVTQMRPSRPIHVFHYSYDLRQRPSQTYALHIELIGPDGEVRHRTQRRFFVYNSTLNAQMPDDDRALALYNALYGYDAKQLDTYLEALEYINTDEERRMRHALASYDDKRKFFLHFWQKRQSDPNQPTRAWQQYRNRFDYANRQFKASSRPGWRTDRGRVLLTYGQPDDVQAFPTDTDKLPYEIWTYNRLRNQSGVIFVFIDRDLATNEYRLHHSTLNGEMYNANWRANVMRRHDHDYSLDGSDQLYDQFKDTTPGATGRPR
jgi:GWxTD domain-containing protein